MQRPVNADPNRVSPFYGSPKPSRRDLVWASETGLARCAGALHPPASASIPPPASVRIPFA